MDVMNVPSPEKAYIVSGQPISEWTLEREEATISRALIPSHEGEAVGKVGVSAWAKATKWQKPSDVEDSINKWIGLGSETREGLVLETIGVPTETVQVAKAVSTIKIPTVAVPVMPKAVVLGTAKLASITEIEAKNPFLQYQGKPYFRIPKATEETEYVTVSYPSYARTEAFLKTVPTLKSSLVSASSLKLETNLASLSRSIQNLGLRQTQFQEQGQSQIQKQIQQLSQLQKQMQKQVSLEKGLVKKKRIKHKRQGVDWYLWEFEIQELKL